MYCEWRDCSLNMQSECYFMTNFCRSTKTQLEVALHQNITRARGDGFPQPEAAVLSAASATTNNLIICGRNDETDTGSPFRHSCVFLFTRVLY